MSVRSGQPVTVDFTTHAASGALTNADSLPTGTLVVNGTDNAASVTVTNKTTGIYKAAVTLPTLAIGDIVQLRINATVGAVADGDYVWQDTKDVLLDSSGKTTDSVQTGDAYARLGAPVGASVSADLVTIASYIDTEVASIKTVTDHLATALELNAGNYRFTVAALANAPTGGGGTVDANVISVNGTTFAGANVPSILADAVAHGGTPGSSTATLALALLNITGTGGGSAIFGLTAGASFTSSADWGIAVQGNSGGILAQGSGADTDGVKGVGSGAGAGFRSSPVAVGFAIVGTVDANIISIDGNTTSGNNAVLYLKQLNIVNDAGSAVVAHCTASGTYAGIDVTGGGSGDGMRLVGGTGGGSGLGAYANGSTDFGYSAGIMALGQGAGSPGVWAGAGGGDADAVQLASAGSGQHDISLAGSGDIWDSVNGRPVQVLSDRIMFSGTLGDQSAGSVDTIILPSGPATNSVLNGSRLRIYSGVGQYQERTIAGWDGGGLAATLDVPWTGVLPTIGDLFHVLYDHSHSLDSEAGNVYAVSIVSLMTPPALAQFFTLDTTKVYADAVSGSVVGEIAVNAAGGLDGPGVRAAIGMSSANLDSQLGVIGGYVDTVESRLPAALVGGRMDASVGAMAVNTLTTAAIADGAITEAKIATPTETAGRPTGILGMIRRLFEWMANKRTRNRTSGDVVLRNAADSATLETQTQSTSGDVDTQTKGV